jgi:PDZ domain-containing secreted protein
MHIFTPYVHVYVYVYLYDTPHTNTDIQTYLLSIVHAYAYIYAIGAYTDAYAEGKLKSGDVLFAVDGTPVYRAPLNLVASKLLGLFFFLEA